MKLLTSTLLVLLTTSAHATSMYNGIVLGKKVGENTCTIFPYEINVVIAGQPSTIGFSRLEDEDFVSSGEADDLIKIARTRPVSIAKHVVETIPHVTYTASEAFVSSETLVLSESASETVYVEGREAKRLMELIDRNCPDLNFDLF